MSLYTDVKYIQLIGPRFRNFKRKDQFLFSLSCPYCGDSEKRKRKARGNFYRVKDFMAYHCYNCEAKSNVFKFLQDYDPPLLEEYRLDRLKDVDNDKFIEQKNKISSSLSSLDKLFSMDLLSDDHPGKVFLRNRKIPEHRFKGLYWCPQFYHWINSDVETNKFSEQALLNDEPRIIIPLLNKDGMHGLQGRSLITSDAKYITIITDERYPKIFGLDRVSYFKPINVLEGCFDSMFIDNAIAMCGGNLTTCLKSFDKENIRLIFDNEPRNKYTVKKINAALNDDYCVVIFPDSITEKDINNMILAGKSSDQIMTIINNNLYQGMRGLLRFHEWRKCDI